MADEEPVNPQHAVEEACKPQCVKLLLQYEVRAAVAGSESACRPALAPTSLHSDVVSDNRRPGAEIAAHAQRRPCRLLLVDWCRLLPHTPLLSLQACAERVEKDESGEAHCTGQYFGEQWMLERRQ
jgi:hypothetical protein